MEKPEITVERQTPSDERLTEYVKRLESMTKTREDK